MLLLLWLYMADAVSSEMLTLLLCVPLLTLLGYLIQLLIAEYRLDEARNDIDKAQPLQNIDVNYDTISIKCSLTNTKFYSGDNEVGAYDNDLVVMGRNFELTERENSNLLIHNGEILATSIMAENSRVKCLLTLGLEGYVMSSTNSGIFPFAVYRKGEGIGVIRENEILLPRAISMELRIFSFIVALRICNKEYARRWRPAP